MDGRPRPTALTRAVPNSLQPPHSSARRAPLAQANEITAAKAEAERDLAEARPALDEALSALNSITQKDITSLKALKNPPDVIKRIFDTVLVLRHVELEDRAKRAPKTRQRCMAAGRQAPGH